MGYILFCVAAGNRFLSGVLLSIALAQVVVPLLQTVFQEMAEVGEDMEQKKLHCCCCHHCG